VSALKFKGVKIMKVIDYECPLCDGEFSAPDYDMKEVWYEPTSDGYFNAYITRLCPNCDENVSIAV
jgi:hypothetical protein